MATDTAPQARRKYVSGVTLGFGMLSCGGSVYSTTEKEESLRSVCPTCDPPTEFLKQKLHCVDGHGPFDQHEVRWASQDENKKLIIVDRDKVHEARASVLPEREFDLQVHERAEVERHTVPSGSVWVFLPEGKSLLYGVLIDILTERRDLCLLAKANLRKSDTFVMVDVGVNGNLILRQMVWPENMRQFDTPVYTYKAEYKSQALALLEASLEPFDPSEYRKDSRERVRQVVAEAAGVKPKRSKKAAVPVEKDTDGDALAAMLQAALEKKKTTRGKKAS